MSDRYAVATGNWNDTAVWSATSGGSPGASAPTSVDNAFLDANSGAITVTFTTTGQACLNLDCTGFTGTLAWSGYNTSYLYGHVTFSSGMTLTPGNGNINSYGTGTKNFTCAGKTVPGLFVQAGTVELQDAFNSGGGYNCVAGTLNSNGNSITCSGIASAGTATRAFDIAGCSITVTQISAGLSLSFTTTGLTLTVDASTEITCTGANHTIALGGVDLSGIGYLRTKNQYGTTRPEITGDSSKISVLKIEETSSGQTYISANNIEIGDIQRIDGGASARVKLLFDAGDTLKVTGPLFSGASSTRRAIIDLVSGTGQHTWSKLGGGTIGVDYWDIQDSIGSPGSTFYAGTHSLDTSNNSGWTFTDPPGASPQTITLTSGIASGEAIGGLTLAPGAVTVSPSALATAEAFGSATVQPGAVSITLTGLASAEAVGQPELNQAINILCQAIASAEAFGSPALTPGSVDLLLSGLPSETAFGALVLAPGALSITPTGIGSAEALGAPTVQPGSVVLLPGGIASLEAHGAAVLAPGAVIISPAAIPSLEVFGSVLLIGGDQVIGYLMAEPRIRPALAGTVATTPALAGAGKAGAALAGRGVTNDG